MDILDVNDFTSQLQKSVKDNLTPEITKVNDLTKEFKNSVIEGNWSVAIDLVGSDKVKQINTELTSSSAYYEKIKSETVLINDKLKSANSASELRNIISDKQLELSQRIANVSDAITVSNEQTIPSIQAQIQQEQTKLSLLNLNDSNYASQLDTVNQLEESLARENARTANLIGQQQALTNLKDVELQKITEIVDSGGQMSGIYTKLGQYNADLIKSSEQNLEVNKDLRDVMSEMGDSKKELIDGAKDVIDEYTEGLSKIGQGIESAFSSLPVVGGMLSAMVKGPLEEATKTAQGKLRDALINSGDATKALTDGVSAFGSGIANIGKSIGGLLVNPIFLIVAAFGAFLMLLKSAYDEMGKIEEAGREFRFSMGASAESTLQMRDMITANRNEFIGFGVSIEDSTKAASALGDVFSSHHHIQKDTLDTVVLLEKQFGIAAESSASAINNVMKIGGVSAAQATKIITHAGQVASKHGLNFAKIMDDVANAGDDVLLFSGGSAKNLAKAAVEARKMGTSIDEMASAADSLLDFESSINAQMQASTMLGRNINLNRLRALAMEGDAEEMAKEQLRLLKEQGGLRNLNRFQQKSLAEAMGVELSTLYNLEKTENQRVQRQEDLAKLAAEGNALAIKQLADQEKQVSEIQKSSSEVLAEELQKTQELEQQKAMQDKMNKAMLELKKTLIPVVTDLMPTFVSMTKMLVPAFQVISFLAKVLVTPFTLIAGIVEWIHSLFTDSSDELGGMNDKVSILSDLFKDTESTIITIASTLAGAFLLFKPLKSFLGGLAGMAKNVVNFFNPFSKTAEKVADKAKDIVSSASDKAADASSKLSKSEKGSQGPGLIERFNKLNTKKLIQAAAALVILAGALWVTAKAFQEFGKVNWKNAWPGFLALGALVFAAKALEKGSMSMIKGAAAVALLGIALIPAAYAFQMFSDVSWKDVIFGGIAIGVLAAAAFGLGLILGPIALGAAAIALLGASIIPLAFALNLAAPALESFGKIFLGFASIMINALEAIIGGILSFAKIVGGVIINVVKSLSGIITAMGDAIVGAITAIGGAISGIITSIANGIATVIGSVSGAITAMVDDITRLSEIDAVNLIAVAGGIGAVGVALASFGVGGGVGAAASGAGNAVGALGNSIAGVFGADTDELKKSPLQKILDFAKESESIILVSDKIGSLLDSFDRLADMETILETAASALQTFGDALSSFGAGNATAGIGNAVGAMGNAVAGMFGADAPQDPIDQLMGFIDKLGSVDLNVESLEILSSLNLGGFLNNITDDFEDKIEMVSDGLGDLFNVFESVQPTTIASIERISGGLTKLLNGLSRSLPKIKTSDSKNLVKVADGLEEFFDAMDEVNTSKIKILPEIGVSMIPFVKDFSELPLSSISEDVSSIMNDLGDGVYHFFDELASTDLTILPNLVEINAGITPFITDFATIPLSSIPEDIHSIMNNVGDGIFNFFDELAPTDLTILPHLVTIQQGMIPFLKAFAQAPLPSEGFDSILIDLGKGIEQFADYVNDGEAGKINTFFKQTGTAFPKFVESMSKLSSIGDLSIVNKLTTLSDISNTLNLENVNKLKEFTSEVVDVINSFTGIQDPAVEALSAITSELYMLCDVIEKLDVDKLGGLQNINLGGVQTPIKIPARKSEQQIIEGTIGPKLMMTEMADLPEVEVALPPSDPFNTPSSSIGEFFSTPIAETQVQQVTDTGTTSLVEVFSTPTTETQVQQVTDTGTTSLAEVFSTPTTETQVQQVTDTGTTSLANVFAEPVVVEKQVKETNVGGIGSYEVFSENLIKEMGDLSLDQYTEKIQSYVENNNQLIKMGIEGRTELDINKFAGENKYMKRMLQEIETEKTYEADNAKMLKTSQIHGEIMSLQDVKNTISKPGGNHLQYHDYAKISSTLGINAQAMEREMFINDTSGVMNHDVFKNEILKLISERETELIKIDLNNTQKLPEQMQTNFEMMDSTSTRPITPSLDSLTQDTLQETATAPTSMLTKIADFTSNLIPDFSLLDVFSDVDKPESSTNIELSGLDTISVKGHNIFVEEIAKIVSKDTPTTESEKTEDGSKVVKKLDELILLMRKGGISVNMDGRKVSRAVASAHDQ